MSQGKALLAAIIVLDALMVGGFAYGAYQQRPANQQEINFYTNLFGTPPAKWVQCNPCSNGTSANQPAPLIKQSFEIVICVNGVILNQQLYAYAVAHNQTQDLVGCATH